MTPSRFSRVPVSVLVLALLAGGTSLVPVPALGAEGPAGPGAQPPQTPPAAGAADDGSKISYVSLGAVLPKGLGIDPFGALYLWRAPVSGESRFRAQLTGIANEVRWDRRIGRDGSLAFVATLDSQTLPWEQAETVQGTEVRSGELKWGQARVGGGLALHGPLGPRESYNGLDGALTVEAGALYFARGSETSAGYVLPAETFEGRLHFRFRADALSRNDLALPVQGWSAGADGTWGVRNRWDPWGDPSAGLRTDGRTWLSASVFAYAAFGVPGLPAEHRLISSVHAGIGSDLDRFSAFRLGNGSTWGDFETLSHPIVPAAGLDEFSTSRYATADLEYRVAVLPFTFLQLRGTLAWVDRPVPVAGGTAIRTGTFPAVTAGATTGLPWNSALEFAWSWNFGLENAGEGGPTKGRSGFLVTLTKAF